jgi:hypothetical protein
MSTFAVLLLATWNCGLDLAHKKATFVTDGAMKAA